MSQTISNKKVLICFILMLIAFTAALNNPFILKMNACTNLPLLDTAINYSPVQAYNYLDALGADGRTAYIRFLLIIDIAFPIAYSILAFLILTFFFQRTIPRDNPMYILRFTPFLMGILDLLQNVMELVMLFNYPEQLARTAQIASIITTIKMNLGLVIVLIIVITSGITVYRLIKNR
jgi:hypothetical protein